MKMYTEIEYKWEDGALVEVSSESFDYEGEVAECKGGGGETITNNYYYEGEVGPAGPQGPAGPPGPAGTIGEQGIGGLPGSPATEDPLLSPEGGYVYGQSGPGTPIEGPGVPTGPVSTTSIAPPGQYTNPYDLMNMNPTPTLGIGGIPTGPGQR